jgi:flagellar hook assembly protein FlgD
MISNMLNYPNPFTTSTAFVFTLTGSEIPPEFKIQILTVTGKVVKEITRVELGPIHIGRNITDYKWDGTDQYGQKLGNGVYLYRVVTSLNGKTLDKYRAEQDQTGRFFNKGYGKMYLMR